VAKKIKILETIRQGSIGGGETYLLNLVTNLDRERFEPVVLSFTDGEMVTRLRKAGIRAEVFYTERPFNFALYPMIRRFITAEKFDLVHYHGSRAGTNTVIPARFARKKIIYTVHGWSFHTGNNPLVTKGRIAAESLMIKYTDLVICGSQADIDTGKKYCGGADYKLIHNSIDTTKFTPDSATKNLREEYGIGSDKVVVTFLARMTYQKDPLTFVKAIALAVKENPNIVGLMIGDGEMKKEVLDLAKSLEVGDKLKFGPFRTDVQNVHASSDIFILPSLWEVVPLALLEAMAMEKACIATDIPGTTEALYGGKNGLLFAPHDEKQLAERILTLAADDIMRRIYGQAARKTVVEHFDLAKLVSENEAVYEEMAGIV
jgi:glycosyltransferase involved in cell wall biosynthesis